MIRDYRCNGLYTHSALAKGTMAIIGAISQACVSRWVKQPQSRLMKVDVSEIGVGHCVMFADSDDNKSKKYVVFPGACNPRKLLLNLKILLGEIGLKNILLHERDIIAAICQCNGNVRTLITLPLRNGLPALRVSVTPILHCSNAPKDMMLWTFGSCDDKTKASFLAPDTWGESRAMAHFFHANTFNDDTIHYQILLDQFPLMMGKATSKSGGEFKFGRLLDAVDHVTTQASTPR